MLVSEVDFVDDAIAPAAQLGIEIVFELVVMPLRFFKVFGGGICVFSSGYKLAKFLDEGKVQNLGKRVGRNSTVRTFRTSDLVMTPTL